MKSIAEIEDDIGEFKKVLGLHVNAYHFIREHKLWEGFWRYGWAGRISLFFALILTIQLFNVLLGWYGNLNSNQGFFYSASTLTSDLGGFLSGLFYSGSAKYILLLFLEVLIFHFCVKTIGILTERDYKPKLKDFMRAEVRMFKVVIRCWILEAILTVLITTVISSVGLEWLAKVIVFFLQCYYIGFAFMDNYLEQYGLEIKQSAKVIRDYAGASIALGLVSYLLILVPLVGLIVAPLLGAVVATLFLYEMRPSSQLLRIDT